MTHPLATPQDEAIAAWIAQAGLRRTQAVTAVLRCFLRDDTRALTHAELEQDLQAQGVAANRVTLYRLLDRLTASGILSRHADDAARTRRYALALRGEDEGVVPRFECDACHRQFPLAGASEPTQAVASQLLQSLASLGHHGQRVDLSIHGTCAVCVEPEEPEAAVAPEPKAVR